MDYFVHDTAVVDDGAIISKGVKIWHFSHVMSDSVIGEGCNLGQNVVIHPGVVLGGNVKVQNNVSIYSGVICDDDVFIGPSAVFTNVKNPRSHIVRKKEYQETYLERGVSVGANATVICGVRLGAFAMIGAGAVVTKDVAPFALLVGNPARHIGWVSRSGIRLEFDENGIAQCDEGKDWYRKIEDRVSVFENNKK
ncbi:UDP-2-acetamido-3-amino-2, 3-dideoxy-D-glucuronate N-acetyltransferase [Tenacibaculum litopenaei]